MKVSTKTTPDGFTVIFHINTEQEAKDFHDLVAIRVCKGPHSFLGDVYNRIRDEVTDSEYDIPLKERPIFNL